MSIDVDDPMEILKTFYSSHGVSFKDSSDAEKIVAFEKEFNGQVAVFSHGGVTETHKVNSLESAYLSMRGIDEY